MPITMSTPGVHDLPDVIRALGEWQFDGSPVQLHPGDLGWHWRFGADAVASAVRTWTSDGRMLAVGFLDGPQLMRFGISPQVQHDEELARQIVEDLSRPERGILPAGDGYVEARLGDALRQRLADEGWEPDEPWTPLVRDLAAPVEDPGVRVEVIGPDRAAVRVAVHRESFENSTFTVNGWQQLASGPAYERALCLVAFDEHDVAVGGATVWSAGEGRPGLLEPVGVGRDHRGRRYGTAITRAAASALQRLGSSSAIVCTPASNVAAVAAYRSGGFEQLADVPDFRRAG